MENNLNQEILNYIFNKAQELHIFNDNQNICPNIVELDMFSQSVSYDLLKYIVSSDLSNAVDIFMGGQGFAFYIGMAATYFWDKDPQKLDNINIVDMLSKERGFDCIDEYVMDLVGYKYNSIKEKAFRKKLQKLAAECIAQFIQKLDNKTIIFVFDAMYKLGIAYELYQLGYGNFSRRANVRIFYLSFRDKLKYFAYNQGYISRPNMVFKQELKRFGESSLNQCYVFATSNPYDPFEEKNIFDFWATIKTMFCAGVVYNYEYKKRGIDNLDKVVYDVYSQFNQLNEEEIRLSNKELDEMMTKLNHFWLDTCEKILKGGDSFYYEIHSLMPFFWLGVTFSDNL